MNVVSSSTNPTQTDIADQLIRGRYLLKVGHDSMDDQTNLPTLASISPAPCLE
jgi:hypothetical protein